MKDGGAVILAMLAVLALGILALIILAIADDSKDVPAQPPAAHQSITLTVSMLLANPDAWVGETIRVEGEDLVISPGKGGSSGVLYFQEIQIFIVWSGGPATFEVTNQDGKVTTAVTGVWTKEADRYVLYVKK